MAKFYKKICFKERQWFYIISENLAILHQKISSHKPLPFGDSFYANVVMKFQRIYEEDTKKFYVDLSINCSLIFLKSIPGFTGIVTQFFERGTVKHFQNYVIPSLEEWFEANPEHFEKPVEKVEESVPEPIKTDDFAKEIGEIFENHIGKLLYETKEVAPEIEK